MEICCSAEYHFLSTILYPLSTIHYLLVASRLSCLSKSQRSDSQKARTSVRTVTERQAGNNSHTTATAIRGDVPHISKPQKSKGIEMTAGEIMFCSEGNRAARNARRALGMTDSKWVAPHDNRYCLCFVVCRRLPK